jgi:hypothetical protein
MDRGFWRAVIDGGYTLRSTDDAPALTAELLANLGSPDAELRETIAYSVLERWIHRGYFSAADMSGMAAGVALNLREGLGDTGTDAVFLRSYSALMLAELLYEDLQHRFLSAAEVIRLFEQAIAYFPIERDLRGYVPEKGWANAVAHGADLLWALAQHPHIEASDLQRLLDSLATKVAPDGADTYIWNEDQRLVRVVMAVLKRDVLLSEALDVWLRSIPPHFGWRLSAEETFRGHPPAGQANQGVAAFHNTRSFLGALCYHLAFDEPRPEVAPSFLPMVVAALHPLEAA